MQVNDARNDLGDNGSPVPDHWQICQLAAMVSNNLPEDRKGALTLDARRRVALAVEIWWESRNVVETLKTASSESSVLEIDTRLAGPLKVGNHFMPSLPDWGSEDGVIDLDQYLKSVIGLSKPADRMRWWRAFMEQESKLLASRALLVKSGGPRMASKLEGTPLSSPLLKAIINRLSEEELSDGLGGDGRCFSELVVERISNQRENGIELGPEGFRMALRFRRWRLGMNSSNRLAAEPHDLEESVRRGLEEAQGGK